MYGGSREQHQHLSSGQWNHVHVRNVSEENVSQKDELEGRQTTVCWTNKQTESVNILYLKSAKDSRRHVDPLECSAGSVLFGDHVQPRFNNQCEFKTLFPL